MLIFSRLRHGPEVNIYLILDILPQIIIDFLPPMEVLQTVVTDFVSPHQSRPQLSASIMAEVRLICIPIIYTKCCFLDLWIIN